MTLVFSEEKLENCWHDIYDAPEGLAFKHWNETQGYKNQRYNPLFERYQQYEKGGFFVQFVAKHGERLVGYAGVYTLPSMHSQALVSVEDTWFLLPEYRKGWNAIHFYRYMENACRKRGVIEATLTLPDEKALDPIVKRLGYTLRNRQYSKNLAPTP